MKKLLLPFVLCLAIAGCGDDAPSSSGLPDATHPDAWKDVLSEGGKIRLTDDMMERYVGLIRELKSAAASGGPALYAKYKFNALEYARISQIIGTSTVRTSMTDAAPQLQKTLDAMKARRAAAATPQMKALLDQQIKAMQERLGGPGTIGSANDVDRHNMEVIKRWRDRLKAAGH